MINCLGYVIQNHLFTSFFSVRTTNHCGSNKQNIYLFTNALLEKVKSFCLLLCVVYISYFNKILWTKMLVDFIPNLVKIHSYFRLIDCVRLLLRNYNRLRLTGEEEEEDYAWQLIMCIPYVKPSANYMGGYPLGECRLCALYSLGHHLWHICHMLVCLNSSGTPVCGVAAILKNGRHRPRLTIIYIYIYIYIYHK